ncbi:MAG: hypothetical protein RPU60_02610 [Candidatus Sedimenticola sp. (ex Thyasira tokunagai)]
MKEVNIKNAPVLLSIFGTCLLSLSIIYDYGYFTYLGFGFSEAPTTLSDHIESSLVWIPPMVIGVFIYFVFELLSRRIEQGKSEEELIETSTNPGFTRWFRDSPKYLFMAIPPLALFAYLSGISISMSAWGVAGMITWYIAHEWFFSHPRILSRTSHVFYISSKIIPAFALFVAFHGAAAAQDSILLRAKLYEITDESGVTDVFLLRTFNEYFLVWHPLQHKHEFIKTSEIKKFVKKENVEKEGVVGVDKGFNSPIDAAP